jgi:hypothetical protein
MQRDDIPHVVQEDASRPATKEEGISGTASIIASTTSTSGQHQQ